MGLPEPIMVYLYVMPVSTTYPTIGVPIDFTVHEVMAVGFQIGEIRCSDSDDIDQGRLKLHIGSGNWKC